MDANYDEMNLMMIMMTIMQMMMMRVEMVVTIMPKRLPGSLGLLFCLRAARLAGGCLYSQI